MSFVAFYLVLSFPIALWLLQNPDFDGQEVSLKLHRDGRLASFEGSSGNYSSTAMIQRQALMNYYHAQFQCVEYDLCNIYF